MTILRILLILTCSLLTEIAFPFTRQKPYIVNYPRSKYHAANKNWSVGQDEKGVMYFGNDVGMLVSDGMEWNLYPMPGMPIVRALAVHSHDTIYVGGTEELGRWTRDNTGRLRYTSLNDLLPEGQLNNETFWRICLDGQYVYFQSFSNIYVYDHHSMHRLNVPKGFLLLQKAEDCFYVQEMYGALYKLKNGKLDCIPGCGFLNGKLARVILPYGKDSLLVGTSDGDMYLFGRSGQTPPEYWNKALSRQLKDLELNCAVYSSTHNTIYLGTQMNGIYEVDMQGNVLDHFNTNNSLQNNTILNLYEDKNHNVWVAMDRGLAYIRYTPEMGYYLSTDNDSRAVYAATLWNGYLLQATNQGVFYNTWMTTDNARTPSPAKFIEGTQGQTWDFLHTSDGKLLCAHNNGVLEITPELDIRIPYHLNTGVFHIMEETIDRRQVLIFVAYNSLYILNKETGRLNEIKQVATSITNATADHSGNIWLETATKGVYKCRLNEEMDAFRYYTYYGQSRDQDLPASISLFKLNGRMVFMGDDRFYTYNEHEDRLQADPLLNKCFRNVKNLRNIVPVTYEQNWAVTSSAVYRFVYDGYIADIRESHRIEADDLSLVTEYENVSILNDSLSFICLDAGFIIHNSKQSRSGTAIPASPNIEYVYAGGNKGGYTTFGSNIGMAYKDNRITVGFTIDAAFADNLYAEYMLEGVDSTWNSLQHASSVSYARLPWRKHVLHLRSTDGLGNYSPDTVVEFEIYPPWYRTIWAYLLITLAMAGMLQLFHIVMQRRLQAKQLRQAQAMEREHLRTMNEQLQQEIEEKNAEMLTLTSFIIHKNELILKLKEIVDDIRSKNKQKLLVPSYNKINTMLSDNLNTEDDWNMFLIKFEQKHRGFFRKLKEVYPQLTNNDLRLCACLKLNMATKDIAALMNASVRAVENNRYRLRKKLELDSTQNLNAFIIAFD